MASVAVSGVHRLCFDAKDVKTLRMSLDTVENSAVVVVSRARRRVWCMLGTIQVLRYSQAPTCKSEHDLVITHKLSSDVTS